MTIRSRAPRVGLIPASVGLVLSSLPALAQEPLFLRIRPSDSGQAIGSAPSDAEIGRAAFAAREAVWERSAIRARLAIASICTGCLKPPAVEPVRLGPPSHGVAAEPVSVEASAPETRNPEVIP